MMTHRHIEHALTGHQISITSSVRTRFRTVHKSFVCLEPRTGLVVRFKFYSIAEPLTELRSGSEKSGSELKVGTGLRHP